MGLNVCGGQKPEIDTEVPEGAETARVSEAGRAVVAPVALRIMLITGRLLRVASLGILGGGNGREESPPVDKALPPDMIAPPPLNGGYDSRPAPHCAAYVAGPTFEEQRRSDRHRYADVWGRPRGPDFMDLMTGG